MTPDFDLWILGDLKTEQKDKNHGFSCKLLRERKELFALLILADCLVQKYKKPKTIKLSRLHPYKP